MNDDMVCRFLAAWLSRRGEFSGRRVLCSAGSAWCPGGSRPSAIAAFNGVLMLARLQVYIRPAARIKRVRDDINANLPRLKLFKDVFARGLRGAGAMFFYCAGRLFDLSVEPRLVMAVPMTLLLGQLALWYEARPLNPGGRRGDHAQVERWARRHRGRR